MSSITEYQIGNIEQLEARSGHSWTEYAAATTIRDLTSEQAVTALKGLLAAAGIKKAAPLPTSPVQTGQSGRCAECGTPLGRTSAGGYCHDCQ